MEKKYIVVREPITGDGDVYISGFDSLEEANRQAEIDWQYLTSYERAKSHIWVGYVEQTEEYIDFDLLGDNPNWWEACPSIGAVDNGFDSAMVNNFKVIYGVKNAEQVAGSEPYTVCCTECETVVADSETEAIELVMDFVAEQIGSNAEIDYDNQTVTVVDDGEIVEQYCWFQISNRE